MVLSAGFGTRLAPLTDEIPKPLVPVGNRPLLLRILENLHEQGAQRCLVNVHYHAEEISNLFRRLSVNVEVLHEEKILGTAGGIAAAASRVEQLPLVVINGDIVGHLPLRQLLGEPVESLRMAVSPREPGAGTVGMGSRGEVVRLRGESFGEEVSSGDYMGMASLGAGCLESLPERGCLVGDWALPWLRAGRQIETVIVETEFDDIGTPAAYWSANMKWLKTNGFNELVDPSAELAEGVSVSRSVIGQGARVLGDGVLSDCVILPGAQVHAPLERVIVTPGGVVMPVEDQLGSLQASH